MIGTYRPYLTESNILKLAWAAQQVFLTRHKTWRAADGSKKALQYRYNENYIWKRTKIPDDRSGDNRWYLTRPKASVGYPEV